MISPETIRRMFEKTMNATEGGLTAEPPHTASADEIAHEAMIDTGDLNALEEALENVCKNPRLLRQLETHQNTLGKSEGTHIVTTFFGMIKVAKIRTEQRVANHR